MNIFKEEFRRRRKSILIWSFSIVGFIIFYMAFFPSMSGGSIGLEALMETFPGEMLEALGIREGLSLDSLLGFFALTFTMVQLAIAIQAANYGFSILSEEERELTADFLMTKPVSRSQIYWSKFFSAFLGLLITAIVISIGSVIALELFKGGEDYNRINVLKLLLSLPVFQLSFLSLGMFISILLKKVRSVISLSMGLVLFLYIINVFRGIIDSDFLGYFTPFYYFEPSTILKVGDYNLKFFAIGIGVISVSLIFSFFIYNKRDIYSV